MLFIQCGFACLLNFLPYRCHGFISSLYLNLDWVKTKPLSDNPIRAFCQGFIRFILAEDKVGKLHFSPIQNQQLKDYPATIVLMQSNLIATKSDAVIVLLAYLGGLWRVIGAILNRIPRRIRNWGYDFFGYCHYKLAGRTSTNCPLIHHRWQHDLFVKDI